MQSAQLTTGPCTLKILEADFDHWHDVAEGFLYGFYQSPPDNVADCTFCNEMAGSIAAL